MPNRRRFLSDARTVLGAHLRGHEEGITAAIFAVALVVLLGMVALGIDGGRLYDERRQAQNAADHAAIAAALASCDPALTEVERDAAAEVAGLASALANNYDDNETTNDVEIDAAPTGDDYQYTATVETTIPTTFAQVIGFGNVSTGAIARAQATGCDPTGSGQAAIHAGGTSCPGGSQRNVEISGNDHTVNGLTRSNGDFENHGNDSDFNNPDGASVEYAGNFNGNEGNGNTYVADESQEPVSTPQWPTGYEPSLMTGDTMWNAYRAVRVNTGSLTPSSLNITGDGVFYTENPSGVSIGSIVDGAKFVIVSKFGPIIMGNEHNGTYHAYDNNPAGTPDNLIVVSGFSHSQPCDQFAFQRGGNYGTWHGLFWTPKADSQWNGNNGTIFGGFISWSFEMNGNQHTINGGAGLGALDPDVLLLD